MLKDARLLIEFQDKVVEVDAYQQNCIGFGLVINSERFSIKEVFIGVKLSINYIQAFGYKYYTYINLKSLPKGGY